MSDEPILEPDTPTAELTGADLPVDADPADALDQRREVPLDDEADSLVGADPLLDDRKGFGDFPL